MEKHPLDESGASEPAPQELEYFRALKQRRGYKDELSPMDLAYLHKYKQAFGRFVKADDPQNNKNLDSVFKEIYGTPDKEHNYQSSRPLHSSERHEPYFEEEVPSYRVLGAKKNTVAVGKTYRFTQYPQYQEDFSELPEGYRDFFNKPIVGTVTKIARYRSGSGLIGYVIEIDPAPGEPPLGRMYDDGSAGAGRLREVEEVT